MTSNTTSNGATAAVQAQSAQATSNRGTAMSSNQKLAINIGLGIAFAAIGVLLAWAKLGFAWNLIIAVVMLWGGNRLAELEFPAIKPWGTILRFGGGITMAVTLLFSGFGQWTIATANWAEQKVAAEATPSAEAKDSSETKVTGGSQVFELPPEGGVITLKPGVQTSFKLPEGTLGYICEVIGASLEEKKADSWKGFVAYRATSPNDPNQDDWVGDPEAFKAAGKTEILIKITPTNAQTRIKAAMAR